MPIYDNGKVDTFGSILIRVIANFKLSSKEPTVTGTVRFGIGEEPKSKETKDFPIMIRYSADHRELDFISISTVQGQLLFSVEKDQSDDGSEILSGAMSYHDPVDPPNVLRGDFCFIPSQLIVHELNTSVFQSKDVVLEMMKPVISLIAVQWDKLQKEVTICRKLNLVTAPGEMNAVCISAIRNLASFR